MAELKDIRKPNFFNRSADKVARDLLGKVICREFDDGTVLHWCITETEAYDDSEAVTYQNDMFHGTGEWCPYNGMLMISCTTEQGRDNVLIRALDCVKGPYNVAERLKIKEIKSEIIKQSVLLDEKLWLDEYGHTVVGIIRKERVGIVKKDGSREHLEKKNYQAFAIDSPLSGHFFRFRDISRSNGESEEESKE